MMHDRYMSETKVTPFRFTDEELEVLGVIEGHTGIRSRTEAHRGVLREHAQIPAPVQARAVAGASAPLSRSVANGLSGDAVHLAEAQRPARDHDDQVNDPVRDEPDRPQRS
jgi:hypothetical protein